MAGTVSALIARNKESFSFLYQETIDSFAQVRFFDPETEVPSGEAFGGVGEKRGLSQGHQGLCRTGR